jgi:glycosyltransferase involved in cell wall biosynthesis
MAAPGLSEFVSIVVATKNALPRLRRLVEACREQPPARAWLVIVDGASSDGTAEWLAAAAPSGETDGMRWISQPDSGIPEAWNRGVALARGEWVVFLGADDLPADPAAWTAAVERLAVLPESCEVVAFPVALVSPQGTFLEELTPRLGEGRRDLFDLNTLPHQGVFHRRRLWDRLGGFDAAYPVACDYEFLVRAVVSGADVHLGDGPPPVRMAFGGVSKQNPLGNLREFRRAQRAHGVRGLRPRWWMAWIRAVMRTAVGAVVGEAACRRVADAVRTLRGLPRVWTVP